MLRPRLTLLLCALMLFNGCGTSIGNPPKNPPDNSLAPVGFKVASRDGADFYTKNAQGENLARITLSVNKLVVKNVSFYQGTKPETPTFAGTYLVDLVAGTTEPAAGLTQLSPNSYTDASFTLVPAEKGQFASLKDEDKLIGNSFHVKGTIEIMGNTQDFEFALPLAQEISLKGILPPGATNTIVAGKPQVIVIGLNVSQWFAQITQSDINNLPLLLTQILKAIQETTSIEVQVN